MRWRRRPRVPAPRRLRGHPLRRAVAPVLVLMMVGAAGVWWWLNAGVPQSTEVTRERDARLLELQSALQELAQERDAAVRERLRSERHREVVEAELAACRRDAEAREAELLVLREELAFYQRLADDAGGDRIGLRNIAVHETGIEGEYELIFQVHRAGLRGEVPVSWDLELEGERDGERVSQGTDDLGPDLQSGRSFDLRFLRTVRVRLVLPEGFGPQRLSIRVDPEEDGPDRIEETRGWAAARRASE